MSRQPTVGILLIVKNEANNLTQCLDSVSSFADQIVVVDSGSSDSTIKIAQKYTQYVYTHSDWKGFGIQRQRAQKYLKTDWILALDADESVDDALKKSLLESLNATSTVFFSQSIKLRLWRPNSLLWLAPTMDSKILS